MDIEENWRWFCSWYSGFAEDGTDIYFSGVMKDDRAGYALALILDDYITENPDGWVDKGNDTVYKFMPLYLWSKAWLNGLHCLRDSGLIRLEMEFEGYGVHFRKGAFLEYLEHCDDDSKGPQPVSALRRLI